MKTKKILILGDVMLDIYHCGEVVGMSQEAPTPKFVEHSTHHRLGAAANVALNVLELDSEPVLIGAVGDDPAGDRIRFFLKQMEITALLATSDTTTTKSRWLDLNRQMFRVDHEQSCLSEGTITKLIHLVGQIDAVDGIIISDYGKGVITKAVLSMLKEDLFKAADPFPMNAHLYPQLDLITPNGIEYNDLQKMPMKYSARHEIRTYGPSGLEAFDGIDCWQFPALTNNPVCVVGAGDVVIACATLMLLNGHSLKQAALFANKEAGKAVMKPFTSVVERRPSHEDHD